MLRRLLLAWGAIALLPAAPAAAQEAAMAAAMPGMIPAEPLTAEQEARLPAAQVLADQVVPAGIYARVMDDTLGTIMGPVMDMMIGTGMSATDLSGRLGLPEDQLTTLSDAERQEITGLLDPAFQERGRVAIDAMMAPLGDIVEAVEPQLRTGIARAYASRFDAAELAAIQTFFATPAGTRFAGELMLVFSDPQVMSASMEMMPQIMERMPQMMEAVSAAMAELPAQRGFADLGPAERARLAALVGVDQGVLKRSMAHPQPVVTTPPPVIIPVD